MALSVSGAGLDRLRSQRSSQPRFIGMTDRKDVVGMTISEPDSENKWQHLYVLPVLLLEFLAIALTRAVLPALLLQKFGHRTYLIMGSADCVRGLLAFMACPLFGKLSDVVGRRWCLLATVLGTCAPVCSLALFTWRTTIEVLDDDSASTIPRSDEDAAWPSPWSSTTALHQHVVIHQHPHAITVFVILLSLSGIFSSTFTLVFAYISDTVRQQDERVSAYGLALATFGLSFTLGPMAGGYLAQSQPQLVFMASLFLTVLDLLYIYFILPESRTLEFSDVRSNVSLVAMDHSFFWNPWLTLRIIVVDPFLRRVGQVAFFYYTGLWALISTLSVYAVQRFKLTPERLGELMSALGLCTMVAEAVLVRIMVPMLGEKRAMKVGLISFALQCIALGFAYRPWHLFVCAFFSLLANLVYPSLSSLVSGSVEPDAIGEALGAINGVKALTEGIGPLVFGSLMTLSEKSALPGWPYLIAAILAVFSYQAAHELPDEDDNDFVHEIERKHFGSAISMQKLPIGDQRLDSEHWGLLSEIEDEDETERQETNVENEEDLSRLPTTFAAYRKPSRETETGNSTK